MFFEQITDEWGGVLYIPTYYGETLLTAGIAFLLLVAMLFIQIHGNFVSARKLRFCALTIGIATLLANIQLYAFPTGGTVTLLSMLVCVLPGYWYGLGAGIATGMAYGIFQMLIDPYLVSTPQVFVDYFLAFGALGLSGLFSSSKYGIIKGYIAGVLGRYFFAVLSGAVFFGEYAWEGWSPVSYSLVYNGIYIFTEAGITLAILLIPVTRRALEKIKYYMLEENIYEQITDEDLADV